MTYSFFFLITRSNGGIAIGIYKKRKKGNVLFTDALNTFYLQLYGIGLTQIAIEDHSDSKKATFLMTTLSD